MDTDKSSANIRAWPPAAYLIALGIGYLIDCFSWWKIELPLGHWLERAAGWTALVAGFAILMTAIGLFKKAGTDDEPWKQVSAFVTDGVYRWTRNAMYLGMALIYIGFAFLMDSLVTLILLVPVVFWLTREVIEKEEAFMAARFGEPYLNYKATTRRWF
ncbi:MAG: isoprenylcysteine carboxylmethyltransferase family protein [Sphingomonas sp.]